MFRDHLKAPASRRPVRPGLLDTCKIHRSWCIPLLEPLLWPRPQVCLNFIFSVFSNYKSLPYTKVLNMFPFLKYIFLAISVYLFYIYFTLAESKESPLPDRAGAGSEAPGA